MVRVNLVRWFRQSMAVRGRRVRLGAKRSGRANWMPQAEVLEHRLMLAAPVANNDSYSVVHDQTLSMLTNVLSNDTDADLNTLTATLVSGPSHASSFTLNSNGSFSYTPSTLYVGSDSFTYKAWDGTSFSNVATASITITNATPVAVANSYTTYKDSLNTASEFMTGVLFNDTDANGDSLTASVATGPSHGSLTLNSNGSFTYTPTAGYLGSDSFTYTASDGIATSSAATVSLTVATPFSAQVNSSDQPIAGLDAYGPFEASNLTGELGTSYDLGHGHELVFRSLSNDPRPVIAVETAWDGMAPTPDKIEATLTFGGTTGSTVYYGSSGASGGNTLRFALQANATSLATGRYTYDLTLVARYGSNQATRHFTGTYDVVNRTSSEFGKGWNVAELDQLASGTGGMLFVTGSGQTAWFTDTGSGTYSSPAGPLAFHTLVKNVGNTYTLTDKFGNKENFSTTGVLTSRVDVNGNTTSYTYTSGKLTTITDPFSRTTTLNYTSGVLTSVVDVASRTTTLAYTSGRLTSVTAPDPDGAGALAAPVTTYAYDGSGRLSGITDPLSHATTFSYAFSGRVSQATYADSNTSGFAPVQTRGLIDTSMGVGSSFMPASLYTLGYADSVGTDELGGHTTVLADRFGFVTSYKDPLNNITLTTRNSNGLPTQVTAPDPDGAGSLTSPVTGYQYDSKGNLTQITWPDSSTETWTYHSTLNVPLTHTDTRGKTTTYTIDAYGNRLTSTDPLGKVTTWTYNSRGQVLTITAPDPDGAGALTSSVTSYTYDSYGRVTRITNPDTTHKDFTYNTSDTVATSADELARTTTYAYDALDRMTSITGADPDGGGALTSPVVSFVYDAASRLTSQTDPLGKVTTYAYSVRNWLTSVTQPDPDGAGSLTAPVTSFGYNAAGWKTSVTDPLGKVTSFGYDADGRQTTVTQPDPDAAGPLSSPVTTTTYDNMGRVTRVTDALTNHVDYAYNGLSRLTSFTDALGKVTSYTYIATGQISTVTQPDPDGAGALSAPVTTSTYDDNGRLITVTDPLSQVTTYA